MIDQTHAPPPTKVRRSLINGQRASTPHAFAECSSRCPYLRARAVLANPEQRKYIHGKPCDDLNCPFGGCRRARSSHGGPSFRVHQPTPCELQALSGGLQAPDPAEFASLFPHPGQKIPRLEAGSGGVNRSGLQVGVAQGGHDRRQRYAGGDGRNLETVSEALREGLGAFDVGVGHGPGDLPVGCRPRSGQRGPGGSLRRRRAEP